MLEFFTFYFLIGLTLGIIKARWTNPVFPDKSHTFEDPFLCDVSLCKCEKIAKTDEQRVADFFSMTFSWPLIIPTTILALITIRIFWFVHYANPYVEKFINKLVIPKKK